MVRRSEFAVELVDVGGLPSFGCGSYDDGVPNYKRSSADAKLRSAIRDDRGDSGLGSVEGWRARSHRQSAATDPAAA